ncbi:MAG: hypothetical protein AAFQ82_09275, partial [Myxococcota bacterium]
MMAFLLSVFGLGVSLCEVGAPSEALAQVCVADGLKYEAAIERALEVSLQLKETHSEKEGAVARTKEARLGLLPVIVGRVAYDRLSDVENPPLGIPLAGDQFSSLQATVDGLSDPVAQTLWSRQLAADQAAASTTFEVIQDSFVIEANLRWSLQQNLLAASERVNAASQREQSRT